MFYLSLSSVVCGRNTFESFDPFRNYVVSSPICSFVRGFYSYLDLPFKANICMGIWVFDVVLIDFMTFFFFSKLTYFMTWLLEIGRCYSAPI